MIAEAMTLDALSEPLTRLLKAGFGVWTDGTLYETRKLVDHIGGCRVEIYHREHAPPHFHVKFGSVDASFAIEDCRHLEGNINSSERRLVEWWYERAKPKLVRIWNETRPSDCPVGPIKG